MNHEKCDVPKPSPFDEACETLSAEISLLKGSVSELHLRLGLFLLDPPEKEAGNKLNPPTPARCDAVGRLVTYRNDVSDATEQVRHILRTLQL